jgi:glycosyltransferase involved in cell wall biosynthesis
MPAVVAASVIVPARNAASTIGRTLAALAAQDLGRPFEVIVVDDGSGDETAAIAERHGDPVRVLRGARRGQAEARNAGVAAAAGEALAFTDADCFPRPDWLREGLAALADADLVQGSVVADPAADRGPFDRTVEVGGEIGLYETANLFAHRELFERLGGFEDWLPARGKQLAEDLWFGWRARRAGAATRFCERAVVEHAVFPRDAGAYVRERARLAYFPAIAAKMPELRETFFHRRWWMTDRSAAFDLALAGVALAAVTRSPLPLLAAAPYARRVREHAARWTPRPPLGIVATEVAADAVGAAALAAGSLRARSLLL